MKKLKFLLPLLAVTAFVFTSCEDDDDDNPSTAELLQRSWAVDSVVFKNTVNGVLVTDTAYMGTSNDFYDFRSDNLLYFKLNTTPVLADTVPYSIVNSSSVIINGDSTQINTLTDSKLVLYSKDESSSTTYSEFIGYLRR